MKDDNMPREMLRVCSMNRYAKVTARSHCSTHRAKSSSWGDALESKPVWRINQHDDICIIADGHENRADDHAGITDFKYFPDLQFNRIRLIKLRVLSLHVTDKNNEHQKSDGHCYCNLHAPSPYYLKPLLNMSPHCSKILFPMFIFIFYCGSGAADSSLIVMPDTPTLRSMPSMVECSFSRTPFSFLSTTPPAPPPSAMP